jgi:hypothetical protein
MTLLKEGQEPSADQADEADENQTESAQSAQSADNLTFFQMSLPSFSMGHRHDELRRSALPVSICRQSHA